LSIGVSVKTMITIGVYAIPLTLYFFFFIGGSAAAAGTLVKQLGGDLIGYLFILEIPVLNGRSKLGGVQTVTLLETNE